MSKPAFCLGIYTDEDYAEHTCYWRDECQYYPRDTRWLTENWHHIDDYQQIVPPQMPPPPNMKKPYNGEPQCTCPYFLPKGKLKRKNISTPFD